MMNSLPLQTRQTLKSLGFSDNECKVLLPLFSHKQLETKEISQLTTLSFENVHYALKSLEKKGLVERTRRNNEDLVRMCAQKEFLEWIDDQKQTNATVYDDAKSTIGSFLTTFAESAWKPDVTYFEGVEGVKDIYEDILLEGKDNYGWHDIEKISKALGSYMDDFIARRVKKKIKSFAIMPTNAMNSVYGKKQQLRNIRFSDALKIDGEIRIYADKVAIITFHKKKPVGFVMSGPIAMLFRGIFDAAWKSEKTGS